MEQYVQWCYEPGLDEVYSKEWAERGKKLITELYELTETEALSKNLHSSYRLVQKILHPNLRVVA